MTNTAMNTAFYELIKKWYPDGPKGFKVNAADASNLIEDLKKGLPTIFRNSTGLIGDGTTRLGGFKLGNSRGKKDVSRPEDRAQIAIFLDDHNRSLCGTENSAFLRSIHSYQVPLAAKRGDKLGKVDLLGTTNEGLPAVIELKSTGKKPGRSAGGLLGPIIQGLAYALTIRHYWGAPLCGFRTEWSGVAPGFSLPDSLKDRSTPIIVASDHAFWESSFEWSKCPWSLFKELAQALDDANLPLFAARFESPTEPELEFVCFSQLEGDDKGKKPTRWPKS